MWKFFNRRKGEQPNVSPPANDNVVQLRPDQEYTVGERELLDIIMRELRAGGAVILELDDSDDGS